MSPGACTCYGRFKGRSRNLFLLIRNPSLVSFNPNCALKNKQNALAHKQTLKKSPQAVPFVALKTGNEERKWNTNFLTLRTHPCTACAKSPHTVFRTFRGRLTCSHEFVDLLWAAFWALHAIVFLQQLIHLRQVNSRVR